MSEFLKGYFLGAVMGLGIFSMCSGCGGGLTQYVDAENVTTYYECTFQDTCVQVDLDGDETWIAPLEAGHILECGVAIAAELFQGVERRRYDEAHVIVTSDQEAIDNYYWHGFAEERRGESVGAAAFVHAGQDQLTHADWLVVVNANRELTPEQHRGLWLHEAGHIVANDVFGTYDSGHELEEIWQHWLPFSVAMCADRMEL